MLLHGLEVPLPRLVVLGQVREGDHLRVEPEPRLHRLQHRRVRDADEAVLPGQIPHELAAADARALHLPELVHRREKAFDGCTKYAAARAAGERVKKKPSLTRSRCFRTSRGMFVIAAIDMLLARGSAFKPRSMSFTSTPAISMGGAPSRRAASPHVIRPCQSSTTRFSMMPR
mmetsp:Transcript_117243/g.328129  ORF Transcript_117243/g.328129 Transcript_117243/m.328129 type:complete len:173 (+) Transcript_117243:602-1120(+)